jgi:hypothetical protein
VGRQGAGELAPEGHVFALGGHGLASGIGPGVTTECLDPQASAATRAGDCQVGSGTSSFWAQRVLTSPAHRMALPKVGDMSERPYTDLECGHG